MRPGRLAAIAATALVAVACTAPGGVAGISATPPAAVPDPAASGEFDGAETTAPGITTLSGSPVADVTGVTPTPDASGDAGRAQVDAATLNPGATAAPGSSAQPTRGDDGDDPVKVPRGDEPVKVPRGDDPVKVPPPKVSRFSYVFPVRGCQISYARKQLVLPHTTIWTGRGCAFVAPVGGVVREVNARNRWKSSTDRGADREGRFVSVLGDDGVLYLGGHLEALESGIRPGVRVSAGQPLGKVGDSGNARGGGPNLYFAVSWPTSSKYWWVRRGMVAPWSYLDAWLKGNPTISPADQVAAVRARVGPTPPCHTLCASKPGKKPTKEPTPTQSSDPDGITRG